MNRLFTAFVVAAVVLGVIVGWLINQSLPAPEAKAVADNLSILTDLFLRLIKMIIGPLVISTLISGIAHMENAASVGRVGVKTMAWFISASIVSLTIGLVLVQWLQPGAALHLTPPETTAAAASEAAFSLKTFVTHLVPSSIVDALARNEILQIVIFSVLAGTAVSALDDRAPAVLALVDQIAAIMLKVMTYVMKVAPLAIFGALAATVATNGLSILATYAKFVGGFYFAMALMACLLVLALVLVVGRRGLSLVSAIRAPALLAFSTASSEAVYPRILAELEKWGVSRKVAAFVLPLGYSFNMDGSMMYCTFATMFVAQAYGIELSLTQQITMLALLMVTSKGVAGVPRASMVVIAATLSFFNLPEAGLLLILAVDHPLDMGRSAINALGNTVASALVDRWERRPENSIQADGGKAAVASPP